MDKKTALELHTLFKEGTHSAKEIVTFFLDRIEKYDGAIGAFLAVYKERAIKKAEELDAKRAQGEPLGKLAGVPVAIKDNMHVEGELTTCASKFLANFKAPFNATVVELLEKEDAIILGKTNLDEFAMGSSNENSALQKTTNPWNTERVPGGSSGGSAAAVAAGFCPIAFGSDTGGSIRQPASLCGIVGFKPTYGRVSRYGLVAFGSSLDQIGPFARNAEDVAFVMEVIGEHCRKDSTSLPIESDHYLSTLGRGIKGMKIGVPSQFLKDLDGEVKTAFEESLKQLEALGAERVEVNLDILKYSIAVYYILATAEASTNLARFDGIRYGVRSESAETLSQVYERSKEEGYGPEVKRRILLGTFVLSSGYQDAYYKKAQKVRTMMIEAYQEAFKHCDLVAMPTAPSAAFELNAKKDPLTMYLEDIYTISTNLAGLPAVSIPNGFSKEKLPLGLQLIGSQKEDVKVIQAAHAYQQATTFHNETPELKG